MLSISETIPGTIALIPFLLALVRQRRPPAGESETARRVLDAVRRAPGLNISELQRRSRIGWASLYLQLRHLRTARLIFFTKIGRRRFVYDAGSKPLPRHEMGFPREGTGGRIVHAIAGEPGLTVRELADRLGLSLRVIYYHVARLDEGRFLVPPEGPCRVLLPNDRFLTAYARETGPASP